MLPARAVAGNGVHLVSSTAVIEDFHIAVEIADMDSAAGEVESQFEEGEGPVQARSADQSAGGILVGTEGCGDIVGGHPVAAHPGAG